MTARRDACGRSFSRWLSRFVVLFVNPNSQPAGIALVTGGSAGLGLAIAEALLAEGYTVLILGRDESRLSEALATLAGAAADGRQRVRTIVADVTAAQSVAACFADIAAAYGRLDVLVNCVGQSDRGRIDALGRERLIELIDANVTSALLCSQAALPLLKASRGVVINVGSLASKVGARYLGGYCAAKHALAGLTQQMRLEWREDGVHVGLVSPGPIQRSDAGQRYRALSGDAPREAQQPGGCRGEATGVEIERLQLVVEVGVDARMRLRLRPAPTMLRATPRREFVPQPKPTPRRDLGRR
jgi:uncharacterized protein